MSSILNFYLVIFVCDMCVCPGLDYGQRVEENTGVPLHRFLPYSFDTGLSLNLKFTFFGEVGSQ